jgi:hypothetical protein
MVWLYVTLALAAATGAFLAGRLVKHQSGKRLIGGCRGQFRLVAAAGSHQVLRGVGSGE